MRDLADHELRLETLQTIGEVRTLYMQLWLLRRQKTLLAASATDSERSAEMVRKAALAGQVAPGDESLFRGEAHRLRADIDALDAEISQAEVVLGKATGHNLAGIGLREPVLPPIPTNREALKQFAAQHAVMRDVLKAQIRTAESRLAVAEEDSGLLFAPRLMYSRSDDGATQGVGIGLALTIPLWDTNEAEKARARSDARAAQGKLESFNAARPETLVEQLHQSALKQQRRAESYEKEVVPAFRQSYERARRVFALGQIPAFEVWQVRERLYQMEEAALKAKVDAYKARVLLETEIGGLLEEVSS